MRGMAAAVAAAVMCLTLDVLPVAGQEASGGPPASIPPVVGGSISVTVGQSGAMGSQIVAILWSELTPQATEQIAYGSFTVDVTSDPFRAMRPILDGAPGLDPRPVSERSIALVPPGTYTLVVWIGGSSACGTRGRRGCPWMTLPAARRGHGRDGLGGRTHRPAR